MTQHVFDFGAAPVHPVHDDSSAGQASANRRPSRRALLILPPVLAAVCAASVAFWLWKAKLGPDTLDAHWDAVALVLAGDGSSGVRDGDATQARFSDLFGVAPAADGSVYVADAGQAQRIRRIGTDGIVSTIAGGDYGYADGSGTVARFSTPSGLAIDATGVVYVADTGNNAIRRLAADGTVSTMAGDGVAGYGDGLAQGAHFNGPIGIAVDSAGRVIVADTYNDRIRAIRPDGTVTTIAGSGGRGLLDGPPAEAKFDTPCGVAVDAGGNIYVADTGNGAVRKISPAGNVTTVEPLPYDQLFRPIGIAIGDTGLLYVTDDRGRIVEIAPGRRARTIAGTRRGFANGAGAAARFRVLTGLAVAARGRLIATDPMNAVVRLVAARSRIELRPPASPGLRPGFDAGAFGWTPLLWPTAPMEIASEIVGTIGEARGGEGSERFHAGLDVHAAEGTEVRVVRDGIVTSPTATADFATLNESVRVGPIAYVHVRVGRTRRGDILDRSRFEPTYDETGRLVDVRVKRGARFQTGDVIGTVNAFNHVHLNVGWPGEEYNPLRFALIGFTDTVDPTIRAGGIRLIGEDGRPFTKREKGRLLVHGPVRIVVDAWDQVDGNEPRRRLGLYRLGYQVLTREGKPAAGFDTPWETMRFDRLGVESDADAARLVYASGSGIPFYGRRTTHFEYVVTNTFHDGIASAGMWDTTALPPGDYTLRILAADIRGNEAVKNRDLAIRIEP